MPQPHSCCRELEKLKKGVRRELCDTNSLEQLELFGEIEQYQYKLSGERAPDLGKMLYLMTLTFPFKSKFSEQKNKSSKNRGAYFAKQQYENKKHTLYRRIEFSSPIFKMILAQAHMSLQKKDCLRKVYMHTSTYLTRLPRWLSGKESACQCKRSRFNPWVGKIPQRRKWQPTPVFLPGKSHGQRNLVGYSLWDCKELDMTERLNNIPYN